MAEIGLHRAQRAEFGFVGIAAKRLGQCGDLDGVTHRRSRAVCLDITDIARIDLGDGLRFRDDRGLAV